MFQEIASFFAERAGVSVDQVTPATEFSELGIPSLELLMLIGDLEEKYQVEVSDQELEHLHTIGDIVELCERQA